ncbi:MAG: hypothetical protein ACO1PW_00805 [Actinomycetota bacterium]
MANETPDTDAMQDRLDEMGAEIDEAHDEADDPKLDLPEVQQDRSFIDPDGDGDPDGPSSVMTG